VPIHLENIATILTYIDEHTNANIVIDTLCAEVEHLVENHITFRDVENFIAYFKFILSSSHVPKQFFFDHNLVLAFINRTYAEYSNEAQMHRITGLSEYLMRTLPLDSEITVERLNDVEERLSRDRAPDLPAVIQRTRIGLVLKWLQGPLEDELSPGLRDYIIFLATVYGQYKSNRVLNVDWVACDVSENDTKVLRREYPRFERAVREAISLVKKAQAKVRSAKYRDEFRIVLLSLDNLVKRAKSGELDSAEAFKDKVLVATTLMYVQDDFVTKDAELKKLVQLFVSLYRQFRDKHYGSN
jgi:hypothetical protein